MNDQKLDLPFRARLRRIFDAGAGKLAFDAFISYSHAADGRLAPALQRAIQRLAKPWYRARALRVFRDDSALSANPHLWSSIQTALDDAEWFVLLASPEAAASEWVGRELTHWLATKSADRILVVLTDGTLAWDGHFLTGTAVPDKLRDAFADEPRHVDLRWAASETDLDTHNARFRDVVAQLAAPMHGMAKDDLEGEDVRQYRRARRLARGGVTVLTLLVIVSIVASGLALTQRNRANHNATIATQNEVAAQARGLSANSLLNVRAHQPDLALLLAVQSAAFEAKNTRTSQESLIRRTLLTAMSSQPSISGFYHGLHGQTRSIVYSPDGELVVAESDLGDVRVWNTRTHQPLAHQPRRVDASQAGLAINRDRVLAIAHPASVQLWDLRTNRPWRWQPPRPKPTGIFLSFLYSYNVALSDTGVLAVTTPFESSPSAGSAIQLWNINTGRRIVAPIPLAAGFPWSGDNDFPELDHALAFSPDGRQLAVGRVSDGDVGVQLVDTSSGALGRVFSVGTLQTTTSDPHFASLDFSPDGRTLVAAVTGSAGGAITRWDVASGARFVSKGPGPGVDVLAVGPGLLAAREPATGTVNLFDSGTATPLRALIFGDALARSQSPPAAFNPADGTLSIGLANGTIVVSNPRNIGSSAFVRRTPLPASVRNDPQQILSLALSPSARLLAVQHAATLDLIDVRTGKKLASPPGPFASREPAFGSEDSLAFTTGRGVTIWDTHSARVIRRLVGLVPLCQLRDPLEPSPDYLLAYSGSAKHGRLLASCGAKKILVPSVVLSWDLASSRSTPAYNFEASQLVFSVAAPLLSADRGAAAQLSDATYLFDPASGKQGTRIAGVPGNAAFSPDHKLLAIERAEAIDLVETATGTVLRTLSGHDNRFAALAFSPDSQFVAASSNSGLDLWDASSGVLVARLDGHNLESLRADNSPGPVPGDPLGNVRYPNFGLIHFSPDGRSVSAIDAHGGNQAIVVWSLDIDHLTRAACSVAERNMSRREWSSFVGSDVPYRRTCSQWPAGT